MTFERLLYAGLAGSVVWTLGLLWWLTRRPKVRRGGFIADRYKR